MPAKAFLQATYHAKLASTRRGYTKGSHGNRVSFAPRLHKFRREAQKPRDEKHKECKPGN